MTFTPSRRPSLTARPELTARSATIARDSSPFWKRGFDLAVTLPALFLTLPLWAVIALWIRRDSPGPIFFRQERVGKGERPFTVLKFRTMYQGTPDLPTDQMRRQDFCPVTRSGRFLRRASLDELPQLINVLRGEMSLVGPRPALPSQDNLNRLRREAGVHLLRPGITGWAQINGRDELSDAQKAEKDAEYLDRLSFRFDLIILVRTVAPVLTGRGNR